MSTTSSPSFSRRASRSGRVVSLVLGAILLSTAFFLYADAERPQQEDASERHIKRVLAGEVRTADAARDARFPGVTRAAQRARLAFLVGGRLLERPVEIGDRVRAGQELGRLDDRELRHAVDAASAALEELAARRTQAERDVQRTERLVEAKAATDEELEQINAGLDALRAAEQSATARLRDAERRLGEARLTAPFAGVVTDVLQEPGEMVSAGRPVVVLSGSGGLEVEIEVPAAVVFALEEGDEAEVELPMIGASAPAVLLSVGRTAGGPGRLFPVVLQIEDESGRLMAGISAEAILRLEGGEGLSVPIEAVVDPGGRSPAVFRIVEEGETLRVRKIRVEVDDLLDDRVLVRGETLQAGDRLVVGGQRGLLDGDAVILGAAGGEGL